ncbi:MAG: hypothetical protein HQL72_14060 [Magnetococcales bacterium]|nr:hypothetical protein [Magnetococcales bacterium]
MGAETVSEETKRAIEVQKGTIFVSIASYRDTECPATLADLFAKAAHPERVFAGVLWQVAPEDGVEYTAIPSYPENVRGLRVDVTKSLGACWARSQVQTLLWQGEDFYLQIDSHTRFDPDWDLNLIRMLHDCPSEKAVLSTHPNKYSPPDERFPTGYPYLRAKSFNRNGILIPQGEYCLKDNRPLKPVPNAFFGGGFVFGRGDMVQKVPYDPYLYFHGEEISMAVRLWSHGYDLFSPNDIILYHDYTDRPRQRHWDDHKADWVAIQQKAVDRLFHLFEVRSSEDPEIIKELDRYGLGKERTLREFEAHANVDLSRRWIGARGADGRCPKAPPTTGTAAEIKKRFTSIYVMNHWDSSETRSGPGSTLKATQQMRSALRSVLRHLRVRTLADAGCGDLNWAARVTPGLDLYLGFDVVDELIAHNRTLFTEEKNLFFNVADITKDRLPCVDAILCRNTLTHLPNPLVFQALSAFKRTGARYLITTHSPGADNEEIKIGHWRRLDLTAPPFSLPKPSQLIKDGHSKYGRFLGVWRLAAL